MSGNRIYLPTLLGSVVNSGLMTNDKRLRSLILVGRSVPVIVVRVVESILGAKKQARDGKQNGQSNQYQLDIHVLISSTLYSSVC